MNKNPLLRATEIGEYVRHQSCERRFKLSFNNNFLAKELPFYGSLLSHMDPVLHVAGKRREKEWENFVRAAGFQDLCRYEERPDAEQTDWDLFTSRLIALQPGQNAYGREVAVSGDLEGFHVVGRIDFVLLQWEEGIPHLRLVECKASRKDRTYHRVQLALYQMLVTDILRERPLVVGGVRIDPQAVECVVARIDEATNSVQNLLHLDPLDLDMEQEDMRRLLDPRGPLTQLLDADLDHIPYQIDSKCDDCALSIHCLPESARLRRIELIGVDPAVVRALHTVGVRTIDDLAEMDVTGPAAVQVQADPGFTQDLAGLRQKARARRRTLPGGDALEDPPVSPLPHAGKGQLPEHVLQGERLVRIYVSVCYDYAENRIGALAAHVTRSERPLSTLFEQVDGRWQPDPREMEQWEVGHTADGRKNYEERSLEGEHIVGYVRKEWSGDYAKDTQVEARLLQSFFNHLVEAIQKVCPEERAPIHFYVWSRAEMTRLMEACSRADTDLLGHLRELLGCRESLEQLIYSVLDQEVQSRYALGWTGHGLAVVSSLKWFGRSFHWTRTVNGEVVDLAQVFRADIFDFQHTLSLRADDSWTVREDPSGKACQWEARACYMDSLPAPYWRACWGTLPDPDSADVKGPLKAAVRNYQAAGKPGLLRAYLRARTQALRWVEESIKFKNQDIEKPLMTIADLPAFSLGVHDAARAALDFLWLDRHVAVNDWIADHLALPAVRVAQGMTAPLRDLHPVAENVLEAVIDMVNYPIDRAALAIRCNFQKGEFVRIAPCDADPHRGQTIKQLLSGGSTCVIEGLDWETGKIRLAVMPYDRANRYILQSRSWPLARPGYAHATMDSSPSDFVYGRVDERLCSPLGRYVYDWFHPVCAEVPPQAPLDPDTAQRYRAMLATFDPGKGPLAPDQVHAALGGLSARVQLLQGPPGTGKTQTTAAALLLRILHRCRAGDIVLVTGNTHNAVDTLVKRVAEMQERFASHAVAHGLPLPALCLARVHSSELPATPTGDGIMDMLATSCATEVNSLRRDAILVLGGTPGTLLKMTKSLNSCQPFKGWKERFQSRLLVVDEASMMVAPVFLSLASLVTEEGELLLAGDHRQLAPIVAHDWEKEDRPPAVLYQPYKSAYEMVHNLKVNRALTDTEILRSGLSYTFRLPAEVRDLIGRLYRLDDIELDGAPAVFSPRIPAAGDDLWEAVWSGKTGLFLVTHSERASRSSNAVEAEILTQILRAGGSAPAGACGIVMPHRAQRTLVQGRLLSAGDQVDMVETVEKFQGGERETILVSATVSEPSAIAARAEFILNVNRANVAFSRAKKRLVVVCSETLLSHIPAESDHYAAAVLWKSLRSLCTHRLATTQVDGHEVNLWTLPPCQGQSLERGGE